MIWRKLLHTPINPFKAIRSSRQLGPCDRSSSIRLRPSGGEIISKMAREAREDAERSLTLDPTLAGLRSARMDKSGLRVGLDGARKDLKKAAELQPGSALVLSYRAYLYECLGELDEAIAVTEEASPL